MPLAQVTKQGLTSRWIVEQELPIEEIRRMRDDGVEVSIVISEEKAEQIPQFWKDKGEGE